MFGSWVLEVAIGLIVVYILFATICATLREGLEAWRKTRAAFLERGIRELLNDPDGSGLARQFYEHPLVFALFSGQYRPARNDRPPSLRDRGGNLPSYIPSQNFALALMDIAARGPVFRTGDTATAPASPGVAPAPLTLATLRASVGSIDNEPVARALVSAIDAAQGDLEQARRNIEQWFDSAMDRVSGWYRRKTNVVVFLLGLALAVVLNVDSFAIVRHLYRQTDHHAIIGVAERLAEASPAQQAPMQGARITQQAAALAPLPPGAAPAGSASGPVSSSALFDPALQLPIGWTTGSDYPRAAWPMMEAGWLLTAFAATLGAPFWFDLLNRFMIVRSTVKSSEKSGEQPSKERTPAGAASAGALPVPPVTPPGTFADALAWMPAPGQFERRHVQQLGADAAADVDGCGCAGTGNDITHDEDLPPAQGGVR